MSDLGHKMLLLACNCHQWNVLANTPVHVRERILMPIGNTEDVISGLLAELDCVPVYESNVTAVFLSFSSTEPLTFNSFKRLIQLF